MKFGVCKLRENYRNEFYRAKACRLYIPLKLLERLPLPAGFDCSGKSGTQVSGTDKTAMSVLWHQKE